MKKLILFFAVLCSVTPTMATCGLNNHHKEEHASRADTLYEHAQVTSPQLPNEIKFAGQTIDLSRYDRREAFDRELISFSYSHITSLLMIKRANRYFPIIEPLLKAAGVPDDFKYLMTIESFNSPMARSGVGAAGLWQFMEATGKEFGLEINEYVDERYHTLKATQAACRYLKAAYAKTGDWLSVAAAYNAGQARIAGELTKQKQESAIDLWLNTETARYIYRLLAVKALFMDPKKLGFDIKAEQLYPPMDYREVVVDYPIESLVDFAQTNGISYADLKRANPWLRDRSLPNKNKKSYTLLIPTQASLHYNPQHTKAHNPHWVTK